MLDPVSVVAGTVLNAAGAISDHIASDDAVHAYGTLKAVLTDVYKIKEIETIECPHSAIADRLRFTAAIECSGAACDPSVHILVSQLQNALDGIPLSAIKTACERKLEKADNVGYFDRAVAFLVKLTTRETDRSRTQQM